MTTPTLPPCPVCICGAPLVLPDRAGYCCSDQSCGMFDPDGDLTIGDWLHINALVAKRLSAAWEQGRDAAAERIDASADLATHELSEHGLCRRNLADLIRALTPPADLASGERRAPVSPRQVTEAELDRAMMVFLGNPPQLPTTANYLAMRELMRAALTAALNPQEAPDAE